MPDPCDEAKPLEERHHATALAARKPAGQPRWLGQALPPRTGVSG
jgi:hypothetical protein